MATQVQRRAMAIRAWAVVGLVVALMVAVGTPVASQAAAPRSKVVISDVGSTASADDVLRLTVRMTRNNLVIRVAYSESDYGDRLQFWIDPSTRARNYYGSIVPDGDYGPLRLVKRQRTSGPVGVCSGFGAAWGSGDKQTATLRIPLRCIGQPDRVRVATLSTLGTPDAPVRDSVPNNRAWTPVLTRP